MEYFLMCLGLPCAFSTLEGFPANCLCDELQTKCEVNSCNGRLPIEYTDFLRITGKVCENQREFLNRLMPNTIIIMMTDSCVGLKNCRDDRHVKHLDEGKEKSVTETVVEVLDVPTQGVPFLPVETQDHANDDDNNDDGDEETTVEITTEITTEMTTEMTTEVATEMVTEVATEQETTETMIIVPYRNRNDEDDHGSPSTSVTVYRR